MIHILPLRFSSLSLSLSLSMCLACILLTLDNFVDRLSGFQQCDTVAYLSEKMDARGRMLTVLFKLLRGWPLLYKGEGPPLLSSLRDDFLLRIAACAAREDENFSLKGQNAVTWLRGIPGQILRIIYRLDAENRDDAARWRLVSPRETIRWVARTDRKRHSVSFELYRTNLLRSLAINPREELLIGYFVWRQRGNSRLVPMAFLEIFLRTSSSSQCGKCNISLLS